MPFEMQDIPSDARCNNENCNHIRAVHDVTSECCELCKCDEFIPPPGLKPKHKKNPESMYTIVCRHCFNVLFPDKKTPPMDADVEKCEKCGLFDRCTRISDYYIEQFLPS